MKKMTCINCPMGCALTVEEKDGKITVSGNGCKRGEIYGKQEYTAPMRTVTSLVRVRQGGVVPVKTSMPVPKDKIFGVLAFLRSLTAIAPVKIGDVLAKNVLGLGADIVATRNRD